MRIELDSGRISMRTEHMFKEFMREIRTDIKKILRTVAVARDLKQQSSRID